MSLLESFCSVDSFIHAKIILYKQLLQQQESVPKIHSLHQLNP
jgi:hypothetical protein